MQDATHNIERASLHDSAPDGFAPFNADVDNTLDGQRELMVV
jgi:hypothetical protein